MRLSIKDWELKEHFHDRGNVLEVPNIITIYSEVSFEECKVFLRVITSKFITAHLLKSGVDSTHPHYKRERQLIINRLPLEPSEWQRKLRPIIENYRNEPYKPSHKVLVKSAIGIYTFDSELSYFDIN